MELIKQHKTTKWHLNYLDKEYNPFQFRGLEELYPFINLRWIPQHKHY